MSRKAVTKMQAIIVAVVIIVAAVAGVAYYLTLPKGPKVEEVWIGCVYPTSGAMARLGIVCEDVVKMAVEDVNEAGGIEALGGAKLRLVTGDAKSDPAVGATEAERLITQYPIVGLTGSYASAISLPVSDVCERYHVPYVTTSCTDKLTTRGYRYLFQIMCYCIDLGIWQVDFAFEYAEKTGMVIEKAAIIYENTAYGTSSAAGNVAQCEIRGLEIVLEEAYPAGFTDAGPLMTKVKGSGADVIFATSYLTDAILIARTKAELEVEIPLIGAAAGYGHQDFATALGDLANGVFTTVPASLWMNEEKFPEYIALQERYIERSGEPFMFENAPFGYAAVWIIKEAVEQCASTDPEEVRDAIAELDLSPPHPACVVPGVPPYDGRIKWALSDVVEPLFEWQKGVYTHGYGHNMYHQTIVVQWKEGVLYTVWPPELAYMEPEWPE